MKQKPELFELIKSLSRNEKRYFKLYASSQKGIRNYIKLFNAIERQENYDEAKIKKLFGEEKFILQIGFTKNYLYNLIIRSLVNYNNYNSVDSKIHSMISQSKILFDKALFRQYFKTIQKVKKLCLKYERYGYLLQVLDMEKMIIKKEEVLEGKADAIYNEAVEAMKNLKPMFTFTQIAGNLMAGYREHGVVRSENFNSEINEVLGSRVMNISPADLCSRAKESYYRVHEIVCGINGDYPGLLNALENRLKAVNESPEPFEDYIIRFPVDIISAMAETCLKLNRIDEAERYLSQIEGYYPENKSDEVDYNIFTVFTKFRILFKKGLFTEAAGLISQIELLLIQNEGRILIDMELSIKFEIIKFYVMVKDFNAALPRANELMNHALIDKRGDYENYLKVIYIIIHFELGNYELLKYLLISAYRFLLKRRKLYKLESVILEFIKKLPGLKNEEGLEYLFHSFRKRLEELKKDKYERNAFEYFDFLKWIDARNIK